SHSFLSHTRHAPTSPLFPYTTLFRSNLCRDAVADGWTHVKMKVGADLDRDLARARLIREEIGPGRRLMMDANQVWDVDEAIAWIDRKSTRLNSSHVSISYAVFCLKKK